MTNVQDWIELPRSGDEAFSSLMDTLVEDDLADNGAAPDAGAAPSAGPPEGAAAPAPDRGGEAAAAAAPADEPGPVGVPDAGAADAGAADAGAASSDSSGAGDAGADAGPDGGGGPPAGAVSVSTVIPQLTGLATAFEERTTKSFQQQALGEVKEEYKAYFDALNQHPRLLVGTEVPALTGDEDRMETLRDANDAREWQEAVKSLLVEEVQSRASKALEDNSGIMQTIHASIELFTKNKDLVPGTREFNRTLADRFAAMAKPYELRVDGRLHGYTIPVQPLVDQLRQQIQAETKAVPPAATPEKRGPGRPRKQPDQPQAGIPSKAGSGVEDEDFSTLFGTLGLPNLRF